MECRFCLEQGTISNEENPMLAPCNCKGSGAYVHKLCLWTWRQTDVRENQDIRCPVCLSNYDTNIVKIYRRELIPDYSAIPAIVILLNPININAIITYMYLWILVLFPYKSTHLICAEPSCVIRAVDTLNYTIDTPMVEIHKYILFIHCVAMLRLIKDVRDMKRYLWVAKAYVWLPLLHRWCFLTMPSTIVFGGFLHSFIIGWYYIFHLRILRFMNTEF